MREELQEYTFIIKYKKGSEMTDADTLSRIHERQEPKELEIMNYNNKKFIKNDQNKLCEYIEEKAEREKIMKEIHENKLNHRGRDTLVYELKKQYYWPYLQESAAEFINKCLICNQNKLKTQGGEVFITTSKPLEKVAADIMTITHGQYLLTFVDYFTRVARAKTLKDKSSKSVDRH